MVELILGVNIAAACHMYSSLADIRIWWEIPRVFWCVLKRNNVQPLEVFRSSAKNIKTTPRPIWHEVLRFIPYSATFREISST